MEAEAIALSNFVHGDIVAVPGYPLRHKGGALVSMSIAKDLERAGLVRIRTKPAKSVAGKVADDGQGQPSSASPAAPASPMTTSNTLTLGGMKNRKLGTS